MVMEAAPQTILRKEADLPFVDFGDGSTIQLLQVDLATGIWIVRSRFTPGTTITTHRHTGHVYAFTQSGSWWYLETPEFVNEAGSYLYEPANSVHTLHVPESNTELTDVWFTIYGANLNLDANGNVELVIDAHSIYAFYKALCKQQHGIDDPAVVVINSH